MAISAYVGVPGSGKSYEVVKSVILPAIAQGRRVVSNVYGLNEDKIQEYLLKRNKKLTVEQLGQLIYVENEKCLEVDFLPSMENQTSFCQAGDLIVIDEVWRIWGNDKEIPKNHRSFIAEHRHFAHPDTGVTCDLVVINQDVAQIPRFIKDRIETTYRMQKHVSLGLKNRYRVDIYQGIKLFKSNRMNSYQEKYQKEIFELYKSYEAENAKEVTTDKRQSIFSSWYVRFLILFVPLFTMFCAYHLYNFFNPEEKATISEQKESSTVQEQPVPTAIYQEPVRIMKPLSKTWRITGELVKDNKAYVILSDNLGRLRLEPRSQFLFSGRLLQGEIDNQIVNYYSGEK
ncbi:putative phage-related membrane protein [Actinobacillus minor 202]|uniref:Phage-related membrane protein n=1 Tax=Actinobacillus minor 202 TaxID=591023 RepID=A0ABP2GU66_9PAST|nr:zonular occludens toxin domain-containing protein [Actinobacillus minor]EEV25435.1 putative phage-related membrane protein [Actinobacillus minor 202]